MNRDTCADVKGLIPPMYEYRGVIHVHSTFSDGLRDVRSIMSEANAAGLDFLILTDHNNMRAAEEGCHGWYRKCLLLVGEEITPDTDADHYLAIGIKKAIKPSRDPGVNIRAVHAQGGIGIIAHPTGGRPMHADYMQYPWTDWHAGDFDGIEIWNHHYDVVGKAKNFAQLVLFTLFPVLAQSGPVESVLETWDYYAVHQNRRIVAIGGVDAHGILSMYRDSFSTVQTHIFTPEPFRGEHKHDGDLVYDALRSARCFVAATKVRDGKGFRCSIRLARGDLEMGEGARYEKGATLVASVPGSPGLIRVIRDGRRIWEGIDRGAEVRLPGPGVYRVEVERIVLGRYRPWIYGNHFFLR